MRMTTMTDSVTVRLNQQQWELVDETVARGVAADREKLFRIALREYWQMHSAKPADGAKPK
jgi:Arc/MetJ-type ribon-helix-helix transcriptional regulator